jgi:hypothetical protein
LLLEVGVVVVAGCGAECCVLVVGLDTVPRLLQAEAMTISQPGDKSSPVPAAAAICFAAAASACLAAAGGGCG